MAKKIMIADDDKGIINAMQAILEISGYEVVTTEDGDVLLHLQETSPDLLLLDIRMSGIDGRAICKDLKSHKETSHIPVIIVSAARDVEKSALEAGADDFIAKPFEMEEFLRKIETNLR